MDVLLNIQIISENMPIALAEWQQILQDEKETGIRKKSQAAVAKSYKIPPSTFNHRVNKRTELLGHASGGARRGRIFNQGKTCSLELN